MQHITFRDSNLCFICMPTYASFQQKEITIEDMLSMSSQPHSNCEVCNIILSKLDDYFNTNPEDVTTDMEFYHTEGLTYLENLGYIKKQNNPKL